MLSVIIKDSGEPNVIQLTFENLYKELKDIPGSELLVKDSWFDLENIKNRYVCFVEPDCLVSQNFFNIQLEDFKQKGFSRQTGIMSAATAINYWDSKIYGYATDYRVRGVLPNRKPRSTGVFSVQAAYLPGSIVRVNMLRKVLAEIGDVVSADDLVHLSATLSVAFWERGYRIYVNPSATYLTTEPYVNDVGNFDLELSSDLINMFSREGI